jgi:uncharacterized protein DUF5752
MSFQFYTGRRLVELTGRRARTLAGLLEHLKKAPAAAVFHHTHERYLTHHFRKPNFFNDFAEWTARALQEQAVAERLAAIDMLEFTSLEDLRGALVAAVDNSAELTNGRIRECPPGDEFHFCKVKSFILPTGLIATNLDEFASLLPRTTNSSVFFHFFEARLRLGHKTNDFSLWLGDHGERRLADEIDRLDPYSATLEELKKQIYVLCRRRLSERDQ